MFIYLITNKVNYKIYIGKTKDSLRKRWNDHRSHAKTRPHTPIHKAIKKYGEHNFTIEVLSTHNTIEELNKAEIETIKRFESYNKDIGYNRTPGGDGAPIGNSFMKGHHHTKKSRRRMAKSHTGLKLGPMGLEQRDKISKALTGIVRGPMSEERLREHSALIKISWKNRRKKYGLLGSSRQRARLPYLKTLCVICGAEIVYRQCGKNKPKTCRPECYSELQRRILEARIQKLKVKF